MKKITNKALMTSLIVGDGGIGFKENNEPNNIYISCSDLNADYYEWKKKLFISCLKENLRPKVKEYVKKPHKKHHRSVYSLKIHNKKLASVYANFLYSNGRRNLYKFLLRMYHPISLAIWMMDDGNCSGTISKHKDGTRYITKLNLRLSLERYNRQDVERCVKWFKEKYGVNPSLYRASKLKNDGSEAYNLYFNKEDSVVIWKVIEPYVIKIPTMVYKFRYMVHIYTEKGSKYDVNLSTLKKYGVII